MRKSVCLFAAVSAVLLSAANAATVTTTFPVTATVLKTCSVTAGPLGFGNYTPGTGAVTGSTTVAVRCTNGSPYTIALNGGTTTGGTITQRLMANGADTLQYNLYTTAGLTTLWGDGTTGVVQAGTGAGLATANNHTVFGELPDSAVNQNAVTGGFSDTITVTVTY